MPVVNLFCGSYCGAEEVARSVIEKTGYKYLDDAALVRGTSKRFDVEETKIWKALREQKPPFSISLRTKRSEAWPV